MSLNSCPSALYAGRGAYFAGTETCRATVLAPDDGLGISSETRHAIAARIASLVGDATCADGYRSPLAGNETLLAASYPGSVPQDLAPREAAFFAHADLVTLTPRASDSAALDRLAAAGASVPQIVALSELIAFVNFETRARLALLALGDPA